MKIVVTIKGLWLLRWCTKFHIDTSSRLWVIGVWNVENRTYTHKRTPAHTHTHTNTHTHTHTSGRQLKIKFLDVLDYSEYSDTNVLKNFFSRKQQWGSKIMRYATVLMIIFVYSSCWSIATTRTHILIFVRKEKARTMTFSARPKFYCFSFSAEESRRMHRRIHSACSRHASRCFYGVHWL